MPELDLENTLNAEQREAVLHDKGPLLIFAGAGSGKTRVLTYRLAHLIRKRGENAAGILAVTFTNKAAKEMKERVRSLIGDQTRGLWIGTFHAICARILRPDIERLGYSKNFVVFDESDQQSTMKEALKALNMDAETYPPRQMIGIISRQKESMIDEETYRRAATTPSDRSNARVYGAYQARLKANNALDFDDMIFLTVKLLEDFPEVRTRYARQFRHIMVDEFQDVNYAQYRLIQILAEGWRNVVCVGDDDQSIYGWRGADVRLILRFEREFSDARVIKLEQNYRSTLSILDCANQVVRNNKTRRAKALWTVNPAGDPILLTTTQNEYDEARWVAERIQQARRTEDRDWSAFGILYRTNAQSRVFEEAFRSQQIPYRMVGGQRFYERKEIKDLVAYLRVIFNPSDRPSTLRAIAAPSRGIGSTSLERLAAFAEGEGLSLSTSMLRAEEIPDLTPRARKAARAFGELIQTLRRLQDTMSVTQLLNALLDRSGYLNDLRSQPSEEAQDRIANIQEFLNTASQFERESEETSLQAFLEQLSLATDLDTYQEGGDAVTLMTLHSAKGLEFPIVFLVGMEEGLFPSQRGTMTQAGTEEERRLCYVGVTRAKERLYLSHAASRMVMGLTSRTRPSRFLDEMSQSIQRVLPQDTKPSPSTGQSGLFPSGTERARRHTLERQVAKSMAGASPSTPAIRPASALLSTTAPSAPVFAVRVTSKTPGLTPPAAESPWRPTTPAVRFRPGDKVRHGILGVGMVVGVDPAADTVRIAFEGAGIKRFQIGIAPIEKVT